MWMTWQQAAWLALLCALVTLATRRVTTRLVVWIREVAREGAIIATLYALWQWVFEITVTSTSGALERGRDIYRFEQHIWLPSERSVQQLTMKSQWLTEALNRYYAYVHVPALAIMILWLFFRHREQYPTVRNVLALTTGACLALQSIPVAPPRLLSDLGFVDTALLYNQSVYGTGGSGISNQLAAMPSVHIAWSVIVAGAVIWASSARFRWVIIAHPIITLWAVVATGNHWWLDAIVAVALIAASIGVVRLAHAASLRLRGKPGRPESEDDHSPADPNQILISPQAFRSRSPS